MSDGNSTWTWWQEQERRQLSGVRCPRTPAKRSAFFRYTVSSSVSSSHPSPQQSAQQQVPGQHHRPLAAHQFAVGEGEQAQGEGERRVQAALPRIQPPRKKSKTSQPPRKKTKTSQYKGVSYYLRIERWETHIWGPNGKQKYLGCSNSEEAAARLYDRAFIKFRGTNTPNFPYSDYEREVPQWIHLDNKEFVNMLRNMSRGESSLWFTPEILEYGKKFWAPKWRPKASIYRGVYQAKGSTRWFAFIRVESKQIRLGYTNTAEEAASLYDRAAIKFFGANAPLNFEIEDYQEEMPKWADLERGDFLLFIRQMAKDIREQALAPALAIREQGALAAAEEEVESLSRSEVMNPAGQATRMQSEEHDNDDAELQQSRSLINFLLDSWPAAEVRHDEEDDEVSTYYRDSNDIDLDLSLGPSTSCRARPHIHHFF